MRFYVKQHKYYCGVDLHARSLYVCIIDKEGEVVKHKNIDATPEAFLNIIKDCREDVVVAAECMFAWYWLSDLCREENIPFVLGHALYMKAIHGGKAKNDRIDSHKIAVLLRGGMIPEAYVYPAEMRATRDLLRRRNHLMRKRADLLAHIQNTNHQYNLSPFHKSICYKGNREGIAERFIDECVRKSMAVDLSLIDHYDQLLRKLEYYICKKAKALTILAHKIGRAVYYILKRKEVFGIDKFLNKQLIKIGRA